MYHLRGAEKINTNKQPNSSSPSRCGERREAHLQEDDEGRAEGEEREHGGVGDQRRVHCGRRRRRGGSHSRLGAGGGRLGLGHGLSLRLRGVWDRRRGAAAAAAYGRGGDLTGKRSLEGSGGGCAPDPDLRRHAAHVRQRGAVRAGAAPRESVSWVVTRIKRWAVGRHDCLCDLTEPCDVARRTWPTDSQEYK